MIAHAALVFFLYWLLSRRRYAAVRAGTIDAENFRECRVEPPESLLVHNNLKNQFELPILFYVVSLALYVSTADNPATVALQWIFVLSRFAHSYVHITSNQLSSRRPVFLVGFFSLVALWVWQAVWLAAS
jgi:hypothetical protein